MKHLINYKIFESIGSYEKGDIVTILFKLPGTDHTEHLKVEIIKKIRNSNSYMVSFNVEGNNYYNYKSNKEGVVIPSTSILGLVKKGNGSSGSQTQIQEPINPNMISQQPTPTDYNKPGNWGGGGVTNDLVLPNS